MEDWTGLYMKKIINGVKEYQFRSILLMSVVKQPLSVDEIAVLDLITTYSKIFGLGFSNLNGDSQYSFAEYPKRRMLLAEANKNNILLGLVEPCWEKTGYKYKLSENGKTLSEALDTEYACEYKKHMEQCLVDVLAYEGWFQRYLMLIMKGGIE